MIQHKFEIGQTVRFAQASRFQKAGDYQIVRKLPELNGDFQYIVRSSLEAHDRLAREPELLAVDEAADRD